MIFIVLYSLYRICSFLLKFVHSINIFPEVNGFIFNGSNSALFIFASFFDRGQFLMEIIYASKSSLIFSWSGRVE